MTILGATSPPQFAIGQSDYALLRRQGMTYVDKTLWVADVLGHASVVHVVPRPRRFGKTLNMSMLRYFVERTEEDRTDLFTDTALWHAEGGRYREHFQRYPTIYLSFKDVKTADWSSCQVQLIRLLARTARELLRYSPLRTSDTTTPSSGELTMDRLAVETTSIGVFSDMLLDASAWLHKVTGQQVIVLIDEYDAPLHAAWQHGYWDEAVGFFRNFLSAGLKDNNHLYKGVLTGILKVAKEGIFSGLNHTVTSTILTSQMSDRFGFAEDEVAQLASVAGCPDQLPVMQRWYNGYQFGQVPPHTMYNPWSILNFLSRRPDAPQAFWKNTSDNGLIRTLLTRHAAAIGPQVELLLRGGVISQLIDENVAMQRLHDSSEIAIGLLLFSGYLTAASIQSTDDGPIVSLRIPNLEVRGVFTQTFRTWIVGEPGTEGAPLAQGLAAAMLAGDAASFERQLSRLLVTMLSYHDVGGRRVEAVYQAFVVGLLVLLEPTHLVRSNREAGYGRADVLVTPRQQGAGAVLELKVMEPEFGDTVESSLNEAITQLADRDYAAEVRAGGATSVHQYAVVFDGKRCWVRMVEGITA
jgi:hypothetical protein